MKVTPEILQDEFIGLEAKIVKSKNPSCMNMSGRIIDETRNTFVLSRNDEKKVIVKESATFHFTLPDGTVVKIDGKTLVGRPEDRAKERIRRRW